jgi:hypothetical protein
MNILRILLLISIKLYPNQLGEFKKKPELLVRRDWWWIKNAKLLIYWPAGIFGAKMLGQGIKYVT